VQSQEENLAYQATVEKMKQDHKANIDNLKMSSTLSLQRKLESDFRKQNDDFAKTKSILV
jgi:hypothetical protein